MDGFRLDTPLLLTALAWALLLGALQRTRKGRAIEPSVAKLLIMLSIGAWVLSWLMTAGAYFRLAYGFAQVGLENQVAGVLWGDWALVRLVYNLIGFPLTLALARDLWRRRRGGDSDVRTF